MAFAKVTVGLRANLELPPGLEAYLAAQVTACGVLYRDLNPDLRVELNFAGGGRGPELILTDLDLYQGLSYRLEVSLKLTDGAGLALGRPATIQIVQSGSPEGLLNELRKQLERRLPRLFADFRRALD